VQSALSKVCLSYSAWVIMFFLNDVFEVILTTIQAICQAPVKLFNSRHVFVRIYFVVDKTFFILQMFRDFNYLNVGWMPTVNGRLSLSLRSTCIYVHEVNCCDVYIPVSQFMFAMLSCARLSYRWHARLAVCHVRLSVYPPVTHW